MTQASYASGRPAGRRAKALRAALVLPLSIMDIDPAAPKACPNVGGQAVIEGVMMRGPARWTVTVRRADGRLENTVTAHQGWAKKYPVLGKPFLRGAVVLLESMIVGIKALNYSAEIAASDEENQKTEAEAVPAGQSGIEKKKPALGFWTLALTLVSAFALAMGLFVALPHLASVLLGYVWGFDESSGIFHLIDGIIKFAVFIGYVWAIGLFKDIARVYAYHGAEHKAIFTYEAGEPLTTAMAARHPAWHPRCGTAFIFLVLALSILFFAAVFPFIFPTEGASVGRTVLGIGFKILLMLPLAGLAYEVTRLAGKSAEGSFWRALLWPGMLMQRLTTRPPDEAQLEVALNALERAVAPH
ncbi:DUF1385 domain-containing protein [Deltaproteobacteria bacterium OttesenSCG-928-M10]|nr:DUF1385 domain-containing protein [Deltaproteobacteria bacterium OttesenSCG-928-M10]